MKRFLARCAICGKDNRLLAWNAQDARLRMLNTNVCHAGMHPYEYGQAFDSDAPREVSRFDFLFRVLDTLNKRV